MISGRYPCCDGSLMLWDNDKLGYLRHQCEHCGTWCWTRISSLLPQTWTEEAFLDEHEVDEATKSIKRRDETPETRAFEDKQLTQDLLSVFDPIAMADEVYAHYAKRGGGFMRKYLNKIKPEQVKPNATPKVKTRPAAQSTPPRLSRTVLLLIQCYPNLRG